MLLPAISIHIKKPPFSPRNKVLDLNLLKNDAIQNYCQLPFIIININSVHQLVYVQNDKWDYFPADGPTRTIILNFIFCSDFSV